VTSCRPCCRADLRREDEVGAPRYEDGVRPRRRRSVVTCRARWFREAGVEPKACSCVRRVLPRCVEDIAPSGVYLIELALDRRREF